MQDDPTLKLLRSREVEGQQQAWDFEYTVDSGRRYTITLRNDFTFGDPSGLYLADVKDATGQLVNPQVRDPKVTQTREEALRKAKESILKREHQIGDVEETTR